MGMGSVLNDVLDVAAIGAAGFFAPEVLPAFGEELAGADAAAAAEAGGATAGMAAEGAADVGANAAGIASQVAAGAPAGAADVSGLLGVDTTAGQGVGTTAMNTAGQTSQYFNPAKVALSDTGDVVNNPYGATNSGFIHTGATATTPETQVAAPAASTSTTPQGGLRLPSTTANPPLSLANQSPSSYFDKALNYAEAHPLTTGAGLYLAGSGLGLFNMNPQQNFPTNKPYSGSLNNYRLSPNFQGNTATPNVYHPKYQQPTPTTAQYPQYPYPAPANAPYPTSFPYPQFASGGVLSVGSSGDYFNEPRRTNGPMPTVGTPAFAPGGIATLYSYPSDNLPDYMKNAQHPSEDRPSVGIYHDDDPNTRNLDALSAAQVRMDEIARGTNYNPPSAGIMRRPTPMGSINLQPTAEPIQAAHGGIMQPRYSLGGYADGGNSRLLKGPGDGMSDDIPAVIGQKQPARLAEGEFVIPADVVSHIGNGSTDAGASKLHDMMTRVRKDRTGNPKQGKQIDPDKYMPA
jgi:hypothetical protein